MITQKQTTLIIFAVPVFLMTVAFFGNLFVESWNWSGFDFLLAAILLFGTAGLISLVGTIVKNRNYKILISLAVIAILVLVWMELAVGLFGTPFAGS